MEAAEKAETGDAIKPGWVRRDAYNAKMLGESERGKMHGKDVGWKRAGVRAAKRDGLIRVATAEQTVVFVQNEFETRGLRTCARIGQQGSEQGLTTLRQGEDNLYARPTAPERPLQVRHQRSPQISSTTV
jgi:hypothetical protein